MAKEESSKKKSNLEAPTEIAQTVTGVIFSSGRSEGKKEGKRDTPTMIVLYSAVLMDDSMVGRGGGSGSSERWRCWMWIDDSEDFDPLRPAMCQWVTSLSLQPAPTLTVTVTVARIRLFLVIALPKTSHCSNGGGWPNTKISS